jgi:hypothetical protein
VIDYQLNIVGYLKITGVAKSKKDKFNFLRNIREKRLSNTHVRCYGPEKKLVISLSSLFVIEYLSQ